jgi:hypothetical protein
MLRFREEVLDAYRKGMCTDLSNFWLRKSKKLVLAVLMVQRDDAEPSLYRGCNMEVRCDHTPRTHLRRAGAISPRRGTMSR